jgi:hypothetical protein
MGDFGTGLKGMLKDFQNEAMRTSTDSNWLSNPDIVRRFFQNCAFIALHTVDDLETACKAIPAKWSEMEWLLLSEEFCFARWKSQTAAAEMQALTLLQAVFTLPQTGQGYLRMACPSDYGADSRFLCY